MEARTLVMELRRRAIKRWVPCGDMDRRLKIPHSAKAECGFRTTPEECLYDSGPIGPHNTIQYNTRAADIERHVSRVFGLRLKCDPVPTKFDTYTSYRIRASTRDTKTLLNSNKWPENVLVKEYYKVIY